MNYKYQLIEKKQDNKIIKGNLKTVEGYKFIPKNEVDYEGVTVSKMLLIKPSFIEKLLKKKIKRKLDGYLKFIIEIIDDEDSSNNDETHLNHVLDDLARYKSIVNAKYKHYLDEKYTSLLLQKIQLLENELREKLNYTKVNKELEEYTRGRSR